MFLRIFLVFLVLFTSCQSDDKDTSEPKGETAMPAMTLTSPAFENNGMIPALYTCDDKNVSPPLKWADVPKEAKSLALICDDPDAPSRIWVHWVMYNIPPETTSLPEALPADKRLNLGAEQGMTDFGRVGYGGPCPPSGTHRYFFKLYALDTRLQLEGDVNKDKLLEAMDRHVIAEAELVGLYKRQ